MRKILFLMTCLLILGRSFLFAQEYTRQDTLRGSNGRGRSWWDVEKYQLRIDLDTINRSIDFGVCNMVIKTIRRPTDSMQIDLQAPMVLDSVEIVTNPKSDSGFITIKLPIVREGSVWWVIYPFNDLRISQPYNVYCFFHGKPQEALNPPWDGGFSWKTDSLGNPWISVSCQGLGASSWWPCKDYQGDEPDSGMSCCMQLIPKTWESDFFKTFISNGHYNVPDVDSIWDYEKEKMGYMATYVPAWIIKNPINTYNVTFYVGDYIHWHDTLMGEKGVLDLDFYALRYHEQQARKQFAVVKQMLHCYEYWMGPYPFYEDGYKLVEAPYLGMEHQSAIAYGNNFTMGTNGRDWSHTDVGLKWDCLIIHESAHEWFGNNITAADMADNWIHEGIACYAETLFSQEVSGKEDAFRYLRGCNTNIRNIKPVIGPYGVNRVGSDIYEKGSAIIHMVRMMMNDDEKFRQLLRGLNHDFYHSIVTTKQVEDYISKASGYKLKWFFDLYLRTTEIPTLQFVRGSKMMNFHLSCGSEYFTLPVYFTKNKKVTVLTAGWISVPQDDLIDDWKEYLENYLLNVEEIDIR